MYGERLFTAIYPHFEPTEEWLLFVNVSDIDWVEAASYQLDQRRGEVATWTIRSAASNGCSQRGQYGRAKFR